MKVFKVSFFALEKMTLLMGFVHGVAMRQQWKLNEEVNDNMAVKREEGFFRCSRIKLDHGEYRKELKPVDYDKCTEELGDSSRALQLRVTLQQTTYVILYTWYTKPLLVSIVRDHDSNDKSIEFQGTVYMRWASPVSRAGPLYLLKLSLCLCERRADPQANPLAKRDAEDDIFGHQTLKLHSRSSNIRCKGRNFTKACKSLFVLEPWMLAIFSTICVS